MDAGKNYGIKNSGEYCNNAMKVTIRFSINLWNNLFEGYYALRALRTEKFFSYWGVDLSSQVTPLECSRENRVKFDVSPNQRCVIVQKMLVI